MGRHLQLWISSRVRFMFFFSSSYCMVEWKVILKIPFLWWIGCLDVLLTFGAYTTARGMAVSRLVIRFFWGGLTSVFVTYLYLWVSNFPVDFLSFNKQCFHWAKKAGWVGHLENCITLIWPLRWCEYLKN